MNKFTLHFKEKYFKKNDICNLFKPLKLIYRLLGFYKKYNCKILEEPKQEGSIYSYPVKLIGYEVYWIIFKIHTKLYY